MANKSAVPERPIYPFRTILQSNKKSKIYWPHGTSQYFVNADGSPQDRPRSLSAQRLKRR
jgi:hypothetical protein